MDGAAGFFAIDRPKMFPNKAVIPGNLLLRPRNAIKGRVAKSPGWPGGILWSVSELGLARWFTAETYKDPAALGKIESILSQGYG